MLIGASSESVVVVGLNRDILARNLDRPTGGSGGSGGRENLVSNGRDSDETVSSLRISSA